MKILIVDDNARLAERIGEKLGKEFRVDIVNSGEEAIEACGTINYSVIVLDIGLPGMTGIEVCSQLRKISNDTPILILSGLNSVHTKVELLDIGADDYLTKPFDIKELRSRVVALRRRRARHSSSAKLSCGALTIDIEKRTVHRDNGEISLRRKEFDILHYLIENQGRILTRQMIMDNVWNDGSSSWISTIDVHIKHLRDKVDRPFSEQYIKTAYGLGYKIDAGKAS